MTPILAFHQGTLMNKVYLDPQTSRARQLLNAWRIHDELEIQTLFTFILSFTMIPTFRRWHTEALRELQLTRQRIKELT